ncbi:biliverdin-producing heme oxygenase [Methylobacterium sp. NEAU 140]|uniref:biliverdin-producing heme oxygenase n=1 Tax=Methylobacterium sp. NEAU 140 TaxID=3064945 RepID=UPI002732AE37|nr:biliverdin-producing heme oxygenase [Methylobacterium sp. NEAU 140]MDP4026407.1 biliverdin-producing heme oxygenase [Methylobacterium sp. NEAU 140]
MSAVQDAGLHARLRAATGPAHAALERDLDWQARVATLLGYRALLARLHGFHAAWEPAIGGALGDPAFLDPRRRLGALVADLAALGLSPGGIAALPAARPIRLPDPAAATGALYVLEGSTLGGRLIARHIAALHGADAPCAYYRAHGSGSGAMWAAFRGRLDALPEAGAPAAEAAAVATFEALRAWLCAGEPVAPRSRRPADPVEAEAP